MINIKKKGRKKEVERYYPKQNMRKEENTKID